MHPFEQIHLNKLMEYSSGRDSIIVSIIDGPVDLSHTAFNNTSIKRSANKKISCGNDVGDDACLHGTFITGILAASRKSVTPGICPECTFLMNPIFSKDKKLGAKASIVELGAAINESVNQGAKIINLSLGMQSPIGIVRELENACNYARDNGVIIVISAGNQSRIGGTLLLNNDWIIPVAGCDQESRPIQQSNYGISIAKNGIMAPAYAKSTIPNNKYGFMNGTSVSSAIVTGAIALLWSIFPKYGSSEILFAFRRRSVQSIIPPLLDLTKVYAILRSIR
jgi:subtilisin family serine protease